MEISARANTESKPAVNHRLLIPEKNSMQSIDESIAIDRYGYPSQIKRNQSLANWLTSEHSTGG